MLYLYTLQHFTVDGICGAVLAAYADGNTIITGAERLRFKESDRIKSIVSNLEKLGINVEEKEDGMIINGAQNIKNNVENIVLNGYNDHRIVMAFSVVGLISNTDLSITDASAINKTYPNFFEEYNRLGGNAKLIKN